MKICYNTNTWVETLQKNSKIYSTRYLYYKKFSKPNICSVMKAKSKNNYLDLVLSQVKKKNEERKKMKGKQTTSKMLTV